MIRRSTLPVALLAPLLIATTSPQAHAPSTPAKPLTAAPPPARTVPTAKAVVAPVAAKGSARHRHRSRGARSALAPVVAANASATREPVPQNFVDAIQVYPYSEGALYQLYAAPERVSDIALQPGEALVAVAAGDTTRWVIGDTSSGSGETKRTHVLVKPFSSDLSTNLVITTDRRSYHLSLASTRGVAMASLSWTYPQDALIALRRSSAEAEAAAPVAQGLAVEQLRFGYAIGGDKPTWRPLRAFDDGRQTFIEFPETLGVGEAPPLFLIGEEGAASLVNYRLRGRFYVVDRLFDRAELRLGTKKRQVVTITRTGVPEHRRAS